MARKSRIPQPDPVMVINPDEVKQTTEVLFKTIPKEQIEKVEKPGNINGKVSQDLKNKVFDGTQKLKISDETGRLSGIKTVKKRTKRAINNKNQGE